MVANNNSKKSAQHRSYFREKGKCRCSDLTFGKNAYSGKFEIENFDATSVTRRRTQNQRK